MADTGKEFIIQECEQKLINFSVPCILYFDDFKL